MHFATEAVVGFWTRAFVVMQFAILLSPVCRADDTVDSKTRILFARKCISCHSGSESKAKFDLSTRESLIQGGESGTAIVVNSPEKSLLWQRVDSDEMPPKHPLSTEEKRLLKDWISSGAGWTGGALDPMAITSEHRAGLDWWSLQPLRTVQIPVAKSPGLRRQPIDDFIAEGLRSKNLSMSPEADRRTLIRRISFDLLGLPPSPADVDRFVEDQRPDAFERLVDQILASPHYGERWARHWLDVVRFGESNGFERDLPRATAWPYRDWVINAFNRDTPYDEFVRWQLAGDLLAPDDAEAIKAVGFLVAGAHDTVVPVVDTMRATMRQDELEDIIGTVSQTFLGLTANCARCHDHKFDPITTREYYQLASALSGIDHGEREFTPLDIIGQLASQQRRIDELTKTLREQETSIRESIQAERGSQKSRPNITVRVPAPLAAWDFTRDLHDLVGELQITLIGSAKRSSEGLVVDGASYASTSPISRELLERTLEVRVRLNSLQQSGGAAISLQSLDGQTFDAIVYSELEPGKWMAGSNGYQRTLSFDGVTEERADKEVVVITQVHHSNGTISAYRNGAAYGHPIRKDATAKFGAGRSQILFGLRHGTEVGGNRMLDGTIVAARLFDTALSPEQVAIAADPEYALISENEIALKLKPEDRSIRLARQVELQELTVKHAELSKSGKLHVYTAIATQPPPMKVHKRGSVVSLGDEVAAAGIAAIQGLSSDFELRADAIESHRRRQLANWITDARNPLFVRTMTNRVWHYHFGTGLVESPNDLGFHAGMPSHPELLEWLAGEFRTFSLKRLHRLLVTSATYRQSSSTNATATQADANNRLLWRMSPHRLEAEAVRDAMLAVAGQLNNEIGGKGYSDVNSYFFKGTQFYDPIDPVGHQNHRRTLYRMWARGGRSPFLDTFDCPDPSTTTPRRSATVTPLQALSLLNHPFSLRMANHFADRLRTEGGDGLDAQLSLAYHLLYGREPDREELALSRDFVARRGLIAFCRAMWNSSEFLFVD